MALYKTILDVYMFDASARVRKCALDIIYSFMAPDLAETYHKLIENATTVAGVNIKEFRRKIADKLIEDNTYNF
jgi:hypothetical protein